ncbi:MAG: hypothetical protein C4527_15580 [Candidatus Omnitrophota bacterium]|jgi:hypothetical protein|nr:MAG: hypothetical protein C4527_15580 [Candidatus Omnitrophota bacterium]
MNRKTHLTEKQLSFYFDGLLDEEETRSVAAHLAECESCRYVLNTFACFDKAWQPDLSDEEMRRLLGNTVQDVHARIIESERRERSMAQPAWVWFFNPKNLLAAMGAMILVCGAISLWMQESGNFTAAGVVAVNEEFEPLPEASQPQKEALITVAQWAKSTAAGGLDYAIEKKDVVGKTLSSLQKETDKALGKGILITGQGAEETEPADGNASSSPGAFHNFMRVGREQVLLGLVSLCASILTLLPLF